jgi:outer membrane protein assembly factor BamA
VGRNQHGILQSGNPSRTDDETNYTSEQVYAHLRFGWNLTPAWQVTLETRPHYLQIQPGVFTALPFTGTRFPLLRGLRDEHELLNRLVISYDSRDSIAIPRHGSLLAIFGGVTDRRVLSSVFSTLLGSRDVIINASVTGSP